MSDPSPLEGHEIYTGLLNYQLLCWIKNVILEKTEVLFCYGKYPILILINEP
jgi:hypothetical protein